MTAYVIFIRARTNDTDELKLYSEKARVARAGHAMTPLAYNAKPDVLEGPDFESAVVLSFPTAAEARAWYDSDAYQAALPHALRGAERSAFIVDGV